ncbi:NXF1 factor, partial [Larus smithsonianus]|nr:NXF1 factor [Larus smithsonianus]
IPYGKKYDKSWLLSSIQNLCSVPFTPVEFHYDHNRAQFYVEDATTASALKQVSRKITDRDNYKVVIIINSSAPPQSLQNELKPEEIEQLKLCMSKRYDGSQRALDLKSLRVDPDLVSQSIDVVLNQRSCMLVVLRIIEDNIPEVRGGTLRRPRQLDPWVPPTLLCPETGKIPHGRNNLRQAQPCSGQTPPPRRGRRGEAFASHRPAAGPRGSLRAGPPRRTPGRAHAGPQRGRGSRLRMRPYLQPNRAPGAGGEWHEGEEALPRGSPPPPPKKTLLYPSPCCSLRFPPPQHPSTQGLRSYKTAGSCQGFVPRTAMRFKLLKHTRLNVVAFLNELPKTQHDINSFVVDICAQTNTLLCFAVHGIFKEVDGKSRDSVRAFTRMFIAVPAGNTGLCIVNDELFVRNATTEEIRKAFLMPAPTPSSSPVPTLSAEQQEMLAAFSMQS